MAAPGLFMIRWSPVLGASLGELFSIQNTDCRPDRYECKALVASAAA
jgi:hypothetical protein